MSDAGRGNSRLRNKDKFNKGHDNIDWGNDESKTKKSIRKKRKTTTKKGLEPTRRRDQGSGS